MVLKAMFSALILSACFNVWPCSGGASAHVDDWYTTYRGFNSELLFNRRKMVFVVVPDGANFANYLDGTTWTASNYTERKERGNCILDARDPELFLLIPDRPGKVRRGELEFDSDGTVVREFKRGVGMVLEYSFSRSVGVRRISTYGGNRTGARHVNFDLSHGSGLLRNCLTGGV